MRSDLFEGLELAGERPVVLGCLAHPDDEAFPSGGTLAMLAERGARVILAYTTRGELGEISDPALATAETLGQVRESEMRESARLLGVEEPIFLGYRDSGMAGTPGNDDPAAFVRADRDEVTRRVVELIRRERPQLVLTFNEDGGYGHPDHIAIHYAAVAAFTAAGDPARYPEQLAAGLAPHRPRRLIFGAVTRSQIQAMFDALKEAGIPAERLGLPRRDAMGFPNERVDFTVDVSDWVDRKLTALLAHRTQMPPNSPFRLIPRDAGRAILAREYFVLGKDQPA